MIMINLAENSPKKNTDDEVIIKYENQWLITIKRLTK